MVIDVLEPTGEQLSVQEYHVVVYDRRDPGGRAERWPVLFFTWNDDYVPLTPTERAQRLEALRDGQYDARARPAPLPFAAVKWWSVS